LKRLNGKERKTDKEIKGELLKGNFFTCFASLPDIKDEVRQAKDAFVKKSKKG